ncbi:MAG: hypothetical protein ACRDA0_01495 [Cetobacterium sp.]|uniref:hypothetical protein n=1 Tax=Cetobacterium sp. TaxID=2071632 RepID=UPI003F355682
MKRVTGLLFLLPQLVLGQDSWRGIPYPMNRWGVSVMGVKQTEKGNLTEASVSGKIKLDKLNKELNLNAEFFKPENLKVDADVQIVKVDYFVLPFMNLYAIGGELNAKVKFNLGVPTISLGPSLEITGKKNWTIEHEAKGKLYGGGALIAGEYNRVFSSLQYTYTRIEMDGDVATKSAEVAMGRLGYVVYRSKGYSVTPYLGAGYQKTDSSMSGPIPDIAPGVKDMNYRFEMELEKVTPSVGVFTVINDSFTVLVDYSFGDRETLAIDLGYRF